MTVAEPRPVRVMVVYLRPDITFLRTVECPPGASIGDAIDASGIRAAVPELRSATLDVGVFSRPRRIDDFLRDGDRVEIYRPLSIDPKQARRLRVEVRRRRKREIMGRDSTGG